MSALPSIVYVLVRYDLALEHVQVLGVYRDGDDQTGLEAAKTRASLEPGVPPVPADVPWRWRDGSPDYNRCWSFTTRRGVEYAIEPHVVEPVGPLPRPRRRRPCPELTHPRERS